MVKVTERAVVVGIRLSEILTEEYKDWTVTDCWLDNNEVMVRLKKFDEA